MTFSYIENIFDITAHSLIHTTSRGEEFFLQPTKDDIIEVVSFRSDGTTNRRMQTSIRGEGLIISDQSVYSFDEALTSSVKLEAWKKGEWPPVRAKMISKPLKELVEMHLGTTNVNIASVRVNGSPSPLGYRLQKDDVVVLPISDSYRGTQTTAFHVY